MASEKKEPVGLKLNGKDFTCTVCGCRRFIRETLVVKTKDSGFLSAAPPPLLTCMICTGCGYAHPFMPQYVLSKEDKESL